MRVAVLGAGVVGVASAWFLSRAGHEVTVIDRGEHAGLETSFANGGQISASHAEPWANPGAITKLIKWLGREDAPLLFRLRADLDQWRWGLRFLVECVPWRARHNTIALVRLGLHSRSRLKALRAETGIQYDQGERGILHFYTEQGQYDAALRTARLMRDLGCERTPMSPSEMVALEPALVHALPTLVGGNYAADDESGDAHRFTRELALLCERAGTRFCFGSTVQRIEIEGDRVTGVRLRLAETGETLLNADAYVVALGSYSPAMLRPIGIRPMIYPVKGYSVTIPIVNPEATPCVSLTDDGHKLVFSRLGERLRVAGTAELNGYDTSINEVRCSAILRRARELFPQAGDFDNAIRWAGLRPATPSNLPYVCATRYRNLYLNTGHGTLGWTMACGSAQVISDLISSREPQLDISAYRVQ